ncbi:DUF378 domain-containing protein [Candidatus Peregrinibacteria bacterium]|nr:MAG: DUF378 domain-containing protein [Candidatus Peregrinibacteria bacterium]
MKNSKCILVLIVKLLVVVGALNWGLVGVGLIIGSDLNVVHMALGFSSIVEAVVYLLVAVAGVMLLVGCPCKKCKCSGGGCECKSAAGMPTSTRLPL